MVVTMVMVMATNDTVIGHQWFAKCSQFGLYLDILENSCDKTQKTQYMSAGCGAHVVGFGT